MKRVGLRIAELRRKRGLTQLQLGKRLKPGSRKAPENLTKEISSYERGRNFTIRSLAKIANALEYRVRDLFDDPRPSKVRKPGRPPR
ncbi:MAG TPA: helix-turn-helix transcriptional regulator [Polyangiaceae bacterium]|nr:helix-turn-helix transcriptional regulator [Polyangiaceae bacterium]